MVILSPKNCAKDCARDEIGTLVMTMKDVIDGIPKSLGISRIRFNQFGIIKFLGSKKNVIIYL